MTTIKPLVLFTSIFNVFLFDSSLNFSLVRCVCLLISETFKFCFEIQLSVEKMKMKKYENAVHHLLVIMTTTLYNNCVNFVGVVSTLNHFYQFRKLMRIFRSVRDIEESFKRENIIFLLKTNLYLIFLISATSFVLLLTAFEFLTYYNRIIYNPFWTIIHLLIRYYSIIISLFNVLQYCFILDVVKLMFDGLINSLKDYFSVNRLNIYFIVECHENLCDTVEDTTEVFSPVLLLIILTCFQNIVVILYSHFVKSNNWNAFHMFLINPQYINFLKIFFFLLEISFAMEFTTSVVSKVGCQSNIFLTLIARLL